MVKIFCTIYAKKTQQSLRKWLLAVPARLQSPAHKPAPRDKAHTRQWDGQVFVCISPALAAPHDAGDQYYHTTVTTCYPVTVGVESGRSQMCDQGRAGVLVLHQSQHSPCAAGTFGLIPAAIGWSASSQRQQCSRPATACSWRL